MLLETKEQQIIGYFCNYFVDLKTLLENKDKLNLSKECIEILEEILNNGPETLRKYFPCGELYEKLYPLYEKNHKIKIDPDDSESVKNFREVFLKKYGDDGEQDDYYKNLLSDLRENHGITEEEMDIIDEEDENKMDLDAIERIHQKESDICELLRTVKDSKLIQNLSEFIFIQEGLDQKTLDEVFPELYETICNSVSLGRRICTEEFFRRTENCLEEIIKTMIFSESDKGIENNLYNFYPEKDRKQINEDCSRDSFENSEIKEFKQTLKILEKYNKLDSFLRIKRFESFYIFYLRTLRTIRLIDIKIEG